MCPGADFRAVYEFVTTLYSHEDKQRVCKGGLISLNYKTFEISLYKEYEIKISFNKEIKMLLHETMPK